MIGCWLLVTVFPVTATPLKSSAYTGKKIATIQFNKQGALAPYRILWEQAVTGWLARQPVGCFTPWVARILQPVRWAQGVCFFFPPTQDAVLAKELLFVVGDRIAPLQYINSLYRLQLLPYLAQAAITLQQGTDHTVDVLITTQDAFPVILKSCNTKKLIVEHSNVAGWGHSLYAALFWGWPACKGYILWYHVPNIRQTAIHGIAKHLVAKTIQEQSLQLVRHFSAKQVYAGRVKARMKTVCHNTQFICGGWLGRSFVLPAATPRLFLTGGLTSKSPIGKGSGSVLYPQLLLIGSIGIAHKARYLDRFIYAFGGIEPIPYGTKCNITCGYQFSKFSHQPYLRLDIAQGAYIPYVGHCYGVLQIGGFLQQNQFNRGVLHMIGGYFSPLFALKQYRVRYFLHIDYLAGMNRLKNEYIYMKPRLDYFSEEDRGPRGTQRLSINLETVVFTPIQWLGFQIAGLGFIDLSRIQDESQVRQASFCQGVGIGIRLIHTRFDFGMIQFKLGYSSIMSSFFQKKGHTLCPFDDFVIGKPSTLSFE